MKDKLDQESLNGMFSNEDFAKMWLKMHTPYLREVPKVGRNEICPFCNSGKKFKNCDCYKDFGQAKYTNKYEKMDNNTLE